ncbi:hypothetical protein PENSPDRAFT_594672 [Peniophora sp. CONT]|nr:hypothetical protein PENSPDRAFT_594672 [Peniophora sp. CONT]
MSRLNDLLNAHVSLLLTDEAGASADFLLHQFLVSAFKSPDARCAFLSTSGDLTRWKSLCSRSGLNLDLKVNNGTYHFIDGSSITPDSPDNLKTLYLDTKGLLETWSQEGGPKFVVLDDTSSLEWIGFESSEIIRFTRALVALARQHGTTLIVRHHSAISEEPDDVQRVLLQLFTYHIETRSLSSGRSSSVSGEIAVHPLPANACAQPVLLIPRKHALQYRLSDASVTYFERGTGQAVL